MNRILSIALVATVLSSCAIPAQSAAGPNAAPTSYPLYVTVMVHMEGNWHDDRDQSEFQRHAWQLRNLADLFEKHGAKLTVESELPFARGSLKWNDDVLKELESRGHGIGAHLDVGTKPDTTYEAQLAAIRERKAAVEALGVTVRHASGGYSPVDWVKALAEAGFQFADAAVGYAYLGMPLQDRPAGWTDDAIRRIYYHDSVPLDIENRIHPWRMASAVTWDRPDPNGKVVYIPGNSGDEIGSFAEGRKNCTQPGQGARCSFDEADIDALIATMDNVLAHADPTRINTWYFHMPAHYGAGQYLKLIDQWLTRMDTYVAQGKIQWKSMPEIYDAYIAWEK
jgi:sugar phosphate isomerase/epimerase